MKMQKKKEMRKTKPAHISREKKLELRKIKSLVASSRIKIGMRVVLYLGVALVVVVFLKEEEGKNTGEDKDEKD